MPDQQTKKAAILEMLHGLEIVEAPRYFGDGGNYVNDHSPMGQDDAIKKIELFIGYGGKLERGPRLLRVAWKSHSEGELLVYRVSNESYVVHGEIYTG